MNLADCSGAEATTTIIRSLYQTCDVATFLRDLHCSCREWLGEFHPPAADVKLASKYNTLELPLQGGLLHTKIIRTRFILIKSCEELTHCPEHSFERIALRYTQVSQESANICAQPKKTWESMFFSKR